MLQLTNRDARTLARALLTANEMLRDHAANMLYRARASKYVRDRVMADYHERQHQNAIDAATDIQGILAKITPGPDLHAVPHSETRNTTA